MSDSGLRVAVAVGRGAAPGGLVPLASGGGVEILVRHEGDGVWLEVVLASDRYHVSLGELVAELRRVTGREGAA